MSMNIDSKSGDKVVFTAEGGYNIEKISATSAGLILNQTYTVSTVAIGGFSSTVILKEFPNKSFNTCLFADALVQDV